MNIRWLGHAAFELEADGTTVLIDPWLTGNPKAAASADDLGADAILLTHGHQDHYGDIVSIAKRTGATSSRSPRSPTSSARSSATATPCSTRTWAAP